MAKFKLVVTGTEFQLNGTKVNPKEVDFQLYDGLEQITVIENVIISDHGKSPLKKWLRKNGFISNSSKLYCKPVPYGISKTASIHHI